jgi:hypothetical protein
MMHTTQGLQAPAALIQHAQKQLLPPLLLLLLCLLLLLLLFLLLTQNNCCRPGAECAAESLLGQGPAGCSAAALCDHQPL